MSGILQNGRLVETTGPAEWVRDLTQAATDHGYGVVRIESRRIELANRHTTLTIESVMLSGRLLRDLLRPQP